MVGDDLDGGSDDDLPATLELVDAALAGCETSVLVEGGKLIARKDCKIESGRIGISVTTGTVTLTDTLISEHAEHGLSVTDMAKVTLENCTIESTDAAAIQLSRGDLTIRGGRIVDYKSAGIIVGQESDWPMALAKCSLHDVKISETSAPGIIAFSGPFDLQNVTLEGGTFGLMAFGPDANDPSSPPLVDIHLDKSSSFLNQKETGIFAKGDARITLNPKSWRALSDERGGQAQVLSPVYDGSQTFVGIGPSGLHYIGTQPADMTGMQNHLQGTERCGNFQGMKHFLQRCFPDTLRQIRGRDKCRQMADNLHGLRI